MLKNIKYTIFLTTLLIFTVTSTIFLTPKPAGACDLTANDAKTTVKILTPWYKYLEGSETGEPPVCRPDFKDKPLGETATRIGIAVIELLTQIAGFVTLGFLLIGGIKYITSQGEPDGINSAKSTITNAIIGLVIVLLAIGLVQFIGNSIK